MLQSSLELTEDQHFQAVEAIESYHRLARTLRDQRVPRECLELLNDLGEDIQAWVGYSDFIYRHPEEWPVYMDEREKANLKRLTTGTG